MRGHLILISGFSQSGKSSLASWLTSVLPSSIHLEQDSFVLPAHKIPTLSNRTDWESPKSIDWKNWNQRIRQELKHPQYILAEGLFVRHDQTAVQKAALIIQLTIPYAIFLQRRKMISDGDMSPNGIFNMYGKVTSKMNGKKRVQSI